MRACAHVYVRVRACVVYDAEIPAISAFTIPLLLSCCLSQSVQSSRLDLANYHHRVCLCDCGFVYLCTCVFVYLCICVFVYLCRVLNPGLI